MRRLVFTVLVLLAVGLTLPERAMAQEHCIVDNQGVKRCRQVADDTGGNPTAVIVGAGLVVGVVLTLLWATRPSRSRDGTRVRHRGINIDTQPIDAWISDESGGLSVGFQW